jgi:hypothetical protein
MKRIKRFFSDATPAIWLPGESFRQFDVVSRWLLIIAPCLLLLLKTYDRWLSTSPSQQWYWYLASGCFGKIDDLSFWIVVAGLLAARNVIKAWASLPNLPPNISRCASVGDLRRLISIVGLIWAVYLAVMYKTNGTFFHDVGRAQRGAQVLEGLTNMALILLFYIYWLLGVITLRYSEDLGAKGTNCKSLEEAAHLLANAPLTFLAATVAGFLLFPFVKWAGQGLYQQTGFSWLDWSMFAPQPLKEILGGFVGACLLVIMYFLPWFWFVPQAKKLLCGNCCFRINWLLFILLVIVQGGIPALIVLYYREVIARKGTVKVALLVHCS